MDIELISRGGDFFFVYCRDERVTTRHPKGPNFRNTRKTYRSMVSYCNAGGNVGKVLSGCDFCPAYAPPVVYPPAVYQPTVVEPLMDIYQAPQTAIYSTPR